MKNDTQTNETATHASDRETENSHAQSLTPQERLINFLETALEKIGYELVTIEVINGREKTLRVFVDLLNNGQDENRGRFGIEDCVIVTRALDEPLETNQDVEAVFGGPYELEVSSPGIDRPLRKASDYEKFKTEIARIQLFRPLLAGESMAEAYTAKNPKQKNYYGILRGYEVSSEHQSVLFGVIPEDGTLKTKKGKKPVDTTLPLKNETLVRIPHELISKANLEPIVVEAIKE